MKPLSPLCPKTDLGLLLPAVNYYHKALHLGCCSSPRSASGVIRASMTRVVQVVSRGNVFLNTWILANISENICTFVPYQDNFLKVVNLRTEKK